MELKNKVVVITGGTKGLGKALARTFLKEESQVVISSRKRQSLKSVSKEIGVLGICADVSREIDLTHLIKKVIKKFGKIDIWINNAGIWLPHSVAENFNMGKVKKMFEVNTFGSINGSRVALRQMKESGSGTILNIISDSALIGRPLSSMYAASKWAMNGFSKSIREENKDISVLSVHPGGMKTDIFGENQPKNFDNFMDTEDVAKKIVDNLKLKNPEEELIIQNL